MIIRVPASVVGAVVLSLAALTAHAQPASATPGIDQRQANQQQRIDQGVASGELNRREARRMERQQTRIERAEDKAKADGTVTAKERAQLHRAQDRTSARIHRQKHDSQKSGAKTTP